jgi:hypothetical protein
LTLSLGRKSLWLLNLLRLLMLLWLLVLLLESGWKGNLLLLLLLLLSSLIRICVSRYIVHTGKCKHICEY